MMDRVMAWALENNENVSHIEKLILIALAYHYVEYKEHSTASLAQIAAFCRVAQPTAVKHLRALEDKQLILRLDRKNTRDRTRYKMTGYINQRDSKYQKPVLDIFIEYFWKLYPHKTHKQEFLTAIYRMQPDKDEQNKIMAGLHVWCKYWEENNLKPMGASSFIGRRLWLRDPANETLS